MYMWYQKYMSGRTEEEVKSAMDHWTEKNRKWMGSITRDPTKVSRAHMATTSITEDQMCQDINWGICAPDDSNEY